MLTLTPAGPARARGPGLGDPGGRTRAPRSRARGPVARSTRCWPGPTSVHAHVSVLSAFALGVTRRAAARHVPTLVTVHSLWSHQAALLPLLAGAAVGMSSWPVHGRRSARRPPSRCAAWSAPTTPVQVLPNAVDAARWQRGAPRAGGPDDLQRHALRPHQAADGPRPDAARAARRGCAEEPACARCSSATARSAPRVERYLAAARDDGLGRAARPAHPRRNPRGLRRARTLYVAPAERESFGIAALEARSAGLPVVASSRQRRRRASSPPASTGSWPTTTSHGGRDGRAGPGPGRRGRDRGAQPGRVPPTLTGRPPSARTLERSTRGPRALAAGTLPVLQLAAGGRCMTARRRTIVSFHAHPDDEALLTGGTLARAAAEGHRVVLVVAHRRRGRAGRRRPRTAPASARRRRAELRRVRGGARRAPGSSCSATPTPGWRTADRPGGPAAFCRTPTPRRPPSGWPRCCGRSGPTCSPSTTPPAATATPTTCRCTGSAPAPPSSPAPRWCWRPPSTGGCCCGRSGCCAAGPGLPLPPIPDLGRGVHRRGAITHRVDVRAFTDAKRAAMAAHASQASGDEGVRTLQLLLRLPGPLARRVLGREWFREPGRRPGREPLDDVFASLHGTASRP